MILAYYLDSIVLKIALEVFIVITGILGLGSLIIYIDMIHYSIF